MCEKPLGAHLKVCSEESMTAPLMAETAVEHGKKCQQSENGGGCPVPFSELWFVVPQISNGGRGDRSSSLRNSKVGIGK